MSPSHSRMLECGMDNNYHRVGKEINEELHGI